MKNSQLTALFQALLSADVEAGLTEVEESTDRFIASHWTWGSYNGPKGGSLCWIFRSPATGERIPIAARSSGAILFPSWVEVQGSHVDPIDARSPDLVKVIAETVLPHWKKKLALFADAAKKVVATRKSHEQTCATVFSDGNDSLHGQGGRIELRSNSANSFNLTVLLNAISAEEAVAITQLFRGFVACETEVLT